jgi:asparagine synthase (glutamine-hydrolysing)
MCGIVGIVQEAGYNEELQPWVEQMLAAQHHRGPDATGALDIPIGILGHNRLSILDLSASSDQPFVYNTVTIVFNGEVYNYVELRDTLKAEGYKFNTTGDTEVVCAAYQYWGKECVKHFVGMWSFAIWDSEKELLFCSRDRFGIKPFNYILQDGRMSFASELNTLRTLPFFDATINKKQVARGLNLGWSAYKDETYYENVKQLEGAHNLIWQNGQVTIERYWDLTKVEVPDNEEDAVARFRELFDDSIRLHMRSDVKIGSCLSGGLDSSAIVAAIADKHPEDYHTYTIYFTGKGAVDERPFARLLEKRYANVKSEYSEPSDAELTCDFEKFMRHVELPSAGSSFYSQYFVMKLASEHKTKVLINGQGSDEFLIGYMHTYYRILADCLREFRLFSYLKILRDHVREHALSIKQILKTIGLSFLLVVKDENDFTRIELKRNYKQIEGYDYSDATVQLENKFKSRTDNFLYHLIMTTTLPTLLHFEDRNSMAFSIESRVPFLDHRLVEYGFSLPVGWRVKNGLTKYVLREGLKDVLPPEIYARKDKKGFVTPGEFKWVKGPLREYFIDLAKDIKLNWRLNVLDRWKNE